MTNPTRSGSTGPHARRDGAELRHLVANELARYCAAMDSGDAEGAGLLLAGADLYFKDHPRRRGRSQIADFYRAMFDLEVPDTAHLLANLRVDINAQGRVAYTCRYQRWFAVEPPTCAAIGTYRGIFGISNESDDVHWLEHHVDAH